MRERKRRPALLVLSDKDVLLSELLTQLGRHDVSKAQVIRFLTDIFIIYRPAQNLLIREGTTEALKDVVKENKKLKEVADKLMLLPTGDEHIRSLAKEKLKWELFCRAVLGREGN